MTEKVTITRKVRAWGGSIGIVIPKHFVNEMKLRKNMRVRLTIEKIPRKKKVETRDLTTPVPPSPPTKRERNPVEREKGGVSPPVSTPHE